MEIQLSIEKLEHIIALAKKEKASNISLTSTLKITQIREADTLTEDDFVAVEVVNVYQECNGTIIYNHWLPVKA